MERVFSLQNIEEISVLAAAKENWPDELRRKVLSDYLAFLNRAAKGTDERPSKLVDSLWHQHILHTEIYMRDMEKWFGRFIHHRACVPKDYLSLFKAPFPTANTKLPIGESDSTANEPERGSTSDSSDCGAADCGTPKPEKFIVTGGNVEAKACLNSLGDCGPDKPAEPGFVEYSVLADCGSPAKDV